MNVYDRILPFTGACIVRAEIPTGFVAEAVVAVVTIAAAVAQLSPLAFEVMPAESFLCSGSAPAAVARPEKAAGWSRSQALPELVALEQIEAEPYFAAMRSCE